MRSFLQHYGMAVVLLLLAACFSIATLREQPVQGAAAARVLVEGVHGSTILIATTETANDRDFGDAAEAALKARGEANVINRVTGEPADARGALEAFVKQKTKLDAIVASQSAAQWLLFADVARDFPTLGNVRLVQPKSERWPSFLKRDNLLNIANQIAVIAIIAIGMTMVIVTGGIDLSVGSLIALSAVTATLIIRQKFGAENASALGMIGACLIAMALCAAIGATNGWLVTRWSLPPFIVTLVTMLAGSGAAYLLARGQSIYQVPESFIWLGRGADLGGLPNAVLMMLLLYIAAHLFMKHTTMGRYLYAVGGNCEAALISGVRVGGVLIFAYTMSGLLAGLGGVVMASQLKSGSPTYGQMYELFVIAAAVVGGTSLNGGKGRMFGTLIGAFIIAVIQNGMNLMNIESYTQKILLGLVILGAVLADRVKWVKA
jgi:ribose transport system permease protein